MQVTFIVNSQIKKLRKVIHEVGEVFYNLSDVNASIVQTHEAGHAQRLAREVTMKGCDYIIAVGGDGTLHEVLNGMMQANIPINKYPILGVLPRGSANDFVKTIGAPATIKGILDMILSHTYQKIDIGKITKPNERDFGRYFINIAGLGLGPEVVKLMENKNTFFGSSMAYFSSIIKGFSSYQKRRILCETDSWTWEGELLQMAVANAKYFGHGLCVSPEADVGDGLFHVTLFGNISLIDYIKNLGNLKNGKKIQHENAHYYQAQDIVITSLGGDSCSIEADGEFVADCPVKISILPNALKFLANE